VSTAPRTSPHTGPIVILLPPSEGKALGGSGAWKPTQGAFGRRLGTQRTDLTTALARLNGGTEALLGVRGEHLARAKDANRALVGAPAMPAWQRYTGVVWDHLDIGSLTAAQRERALSSIIVVSGLLGAVRADDRIPDYRLKMGARLAPFGAVAAWWHDELSETLNDALAGRVVIDLLPNEHRRAYTADPERLRDYVRVGLFEKSGKAGGHDAKAAKGRLARHLIVTCTSAAKAHASIESFRDPRFIARID
jgi:cytoplasmic iron level regulating protein YaaA (DUF328/UPF0246 family)